MILSREHLNHLPSPTGQPNHVSVIKKKKGVDDKVGVIMQEIRKWNYNWVTEIREEFRGMEQQRNI